MAPSLPAFPKDQKEKPNVLLEVNALETQLLTTIHAKGLVHSDVWDLFHKICSVYETVILSDLELKELQDVEYSLWKLHYMHIDEFRKKIKGKPGSSENTASGFQQNCASDIYIKEFRIFLQEATDFYKSLSEKFRNYCGIPEEPSYKWESLAPSNNLRKCQFLRHRFLVCLGDLARYKEQYGNLSDKNPNWSVAVSYYLEAKMIWSDSGNPHNQLAVLARCVGDEFLALYHCVRSLAVKEPFPDAWNNLVLLFESNRSWDLHLTSNNVKFDFLRPYERSNGLLIKDSSKFPLLNGEGGNCLGTNLWPLTIRTLGFFFLKSSLEDFSCVFASTMRELDMVMELDDIKLGTMLESYQLMDSGRTGPFRAVQVVSLFLFLFHNLMTNSAANGSEDSKNTWNHGLAQLASVMFIFMGRFVDRCAKAELLNSCPLLPALLIFVEWLAGLIDEVEACTFDDRTKAAMSYFFAAFVDLLEHFKDRVEVLSLETSALWEDYELKGFVPMAQTHVPLNFSIRFEHMGSYESGSECRVRRIFLAAMKIADRSNGSRKWITYDKLANIFSFSEGKQESAKASLTDSGTTETAFEIQIHRRKADKQMVVTKSIATDEEEVILFKPLTRYNSAPVGTYIKGKIAASSKEMMDQTIPSDECLRRATSVLIAQNGVTGDHSNVHSVISSPWSGQPFKQQDPLSKDTTSKSPLEASFPSGPPSLSAWVLNVNNNREQGRTNVRRQGLSPIEEMASESLSALSMNQTDGIGTPSQSAANYNSPAYTAPMPSAPLLPADASWINGAPTGISNLNNSAGLSKTENFYDALRVSSYPNWPANSQSDFGTSAPGFVNKYTPVRGLTSSEWLRQYRESRNLEQINTPSWPMNHLSAVNPWKFPGRDTSQLGLFDLYGIPPSPNSWFYGQAPSFFPGGIVGYGADEPRADKFYPEYSRPSLYGCGAVTELREEPQPLLQYLKEKEWLLQQEPRLRNPAFMGN